MHSYYNRYSPDASCGWGVLFSATWGRWKRNAVPIPYPFSQLCPSCDYVVRKSPSISISSPGRLSLLAGVHRTETGNKSLPALILQYLPCVLIFERDLARGAVITHQSRITDRDISRPLLKIRYRIVTNLHDFHDQVVGLYSRLLLVGRQIWTGRQSNQPDNARAR